MKKNNFTLPALLVFAFATLFNTQSFSQKRYNGATIEKLIAAWSVGMEQVKVKYNATQKEFDVFHRFYSHELDSLQIQFNNKMFSEAISLDNVKEYVASKREYVESLFKNFRQAEKDYPSSVDEYKYTGRPRIGGDSCFATCYNTNFETGDLSGWYGYYGVNNSPNNNTGPFNITGVTGGYLGPVVRSPLDPNTGTNQIRITGGTATDYFLNTYSSYTMSQVSPFGGNYSVMLGDSTMNGQGVAILSQSFMVSANTPSLSYQYSLFLENPSGHDFYAQPFFTVAVLDQSGDTIPSCGQYSVSADSALRDGFRGVFYPVEFDSVYWKNWTFVNVPLKNYIGQCVTIIFQVQDCSLGGHFGYAYVDASCSPLAVISSSPNFCGQDSISLTAPPGASSYSWTGPTNGILSGSHSQTVWVDSSGNYTVVTIPVTGAACADTITTHIGRLPGPPPIPTFTADTVCAGTPTQFINTSDSTKGQFSWDFYNIGNYNYIDTNNFNPTWTYINPGIYVVKLNEVLTNGCGASVYDTIVVDTNVTNPSFTASPTCIGDTTFFVPTAPGAATYDWNFGDPTTGIHDSSKLESPGHKFSGAGSYTVTLTVDNRGGCGAIYSQVVTIYAFPTPSVSGKNTVCSGSRDTLTASGGTSYIWLPSGNTNVSISGSPTVTTTFTLEAFNGTCSKDTTFTINVVPAPSPSVTATPDSACKGTMITLTGSGGTTYIWALNGSTKTSITVTLDSSTTYKLYEFGGTCEDSISIKVPMIPKITADTAIQFDSVCPGASDIISAIGKGGPVTYKWSTGSTNSSITVNPVTNTTYTATVYGICDSVNKTVKISVIPVPKPTITGPTYECKGSPATITVSSTTNPTKYVWNDGRTTTSYTTGVINADSTFSVTATNSLGCDTTITYTIDVRDYPSVIVNPPRSICPGTDVKLYATANGQGPFTYSWEPGGSTDDTVTVAPGSATTYTVTVTNGCKTTKTTTITPNYAPTIYACCNKTILIGEDTTIGAFGDSIVSYSWAPDSGLVCLNPPKCDTVKVSPNVTTTYTVTGTDKNGCETSHVVTISIEIPCLDLTIPNVITPNDPGPLGLNAVFYIKTENVTPWSLNIYDRWGKEVYTSSNPNEYWAGTTLGGDKAPDGVYYYIITGTCQAVTYKKDGFVQLIR